MNQKNPRGENVLFVNHVDQKRRQISDIFYDREEKER